MDCYYHNAVPSVGVCHDCTQTICATCRDETGICPGCRLERRLQAASASRPGLSGARGPQNPPPGPQARGARTATATATVDRTSKLAVTTISNETRGLLALGYPLWPLAALALLDPKKSSAVRRQALQALGVNFGLFGLSFGLAVIGQIPVLGWSAGPLLVVIFPVWLVATVIYGFKVWNGEDVRVPLISDWLDERDARRQDPSVSA